MQTISLALMSDEHAIINVSIISNRSIKEIANMVAPGQPSRLPSAENFEDEYAATAEMGSRIGTGVPLTYISNHRIARDAIIQFVASDGHGESKWRAMSNERIASQLRAITETLLTVWKCRSLAVRMEEADFSKLLGE